MRKLNVVIIIIAFVACAIASRASAQETTGTITGRVSIRRAWPCQASPSPPPGRRAARLP